MILLLFLSYMKSLNIVYIFVVMTLWKMEYLKFKFPDSFHELLLFLLRRNKQRTRFVKTEKLRGLQIRKSAPRIPVTITKGSVHILAHRGFVDYILHDRRAAIFLEWVKDTGITSTLFLPTIQCYNLNSCIAHCILTI